MSDNEKTHKEETWKSKIFVYLGIFLIIIIGRIVGKTVGISAIAGLIGGAYIYEYIAKTRSTLVSITVAAFSVIIITAYTYIVLVAIFY